MVRVRINPVALWEAMARRNLSQNELARELGISSGYMSQLLCGTRYPSPRLRRRMLERLTPAGFNDLFYIENYGNDNHTA